MSTFIFKDISSPSLLDGDVLETMPYVNDEQKSIALAIVIFNIYLSDSFIVQIRALLKIEMFHIPIFMLYYNYETSGDGMLNAISRMQVHIKQFSSLMKVSRNLHTWRFFLSCICKYTILCYH